jgi:molecular chaperone DnaJ
VSEKRDYYEVLGVSREADSTELKRAYRKLAVKFHPDRNPGDKEAENSFKEAAEAYQVLSDPERRALYDRYGHEAPSAGAGFGGFRDVGDVFSAFSDIFGDLFGGGGGRGPAPGADIESAIELTLEEAATGVTREVRYRRQAACEDCRGSGAAPGTSPETCPQCRGRGQVVHSQGFLMITTTCARCRGEGKVIRKVCPSCEGSGVVLVEDRLSVSIPAGVEDGATLRIGGRGQISPRGGRAGNLYVAIHVKADPRFERDGADLHAEVTISFAQAALGSRVTVPTLSGDEEVEVERGTQPGDSVVLRGRGLPRLRERGQGDLHVHFRLVVPRALSDEQEARLRAFAELDENAPEPPEEKRGLFGRRRK